MEITTETFTGLPQTSDLRRVQLLKILNEKVRFIYNGADKIDQKIITNLSKTKFDVIIAGGGPAGLYAAYELSKRRIKTLLLEKTLLLDTNNTIGLPAKIVQRYSLQPAINRYHKNTYFRDYLGLDFPSQIDYCIMDQTKVLFLLASRVDPDYCTIIENCEVTAYARIHEGNELDIKTIINGFQLLRYQQALKTAPRAVQLLSINKYLYEKYDPYVCVNLFDEFDAKEKLTPNFHFNTKILINAAGYASSISKSFHRQKRCKVWKCLVYEFENLDKPQPEIIWDLAIPTETSANFWVDVSDKDKVSAGVMVLTRTAPNIPDGYPSKGVLDEYMNKWLNIRKITGNIIRERYGIIPMTDFMEPAAYDNIVFIGVSSSRQIPNTGFGFFPALEEARLLSEVIVKALEKKDYSQKFLRNYDIKWLKQNELSMALDIVLQDFHYAYRRDEFFHEFTKRTTQVPQEVVKNRICAELDISQLFIFAKVFARNSFLLSKNRIEKNMYDKLLTDIGRFIYCFLSQKLFFYHPEGNPIFKYEPPKLIFFLSPLRIIDIFIRRTAPEFLCKQIARLFFQRIFQPILRLFLEISLAVIHIFRWIYRLIGKIFSRSRETAAQEGLTTYE